VSAFCCKVQARHVNVEMISARLPSITARPRSEEKVRFAHLAAARGLSESALALIAIRDLLQSSAPTSKLPPASVKEAAIDRITIRLRPGDRQAIRHRAGMRGMRDSAYLAALVRAHVAASPPLAADELAALKLAVTVLAGFGRLLARTAREATQAGAMAKELQQEPHESTRGRPGAARARSSTRGARELGELN
jgi:hypothetical protein